MSDARIPVFRPTFPTSSKIAAYIDEAASTGQFSNGGPLVTRLEERLAQHFGILPFHVALCSSGTMALEGAIATVDSDTSPWMLPAWTFTATPGAVSRSGKSAYFVDADASQRAVFAPGTKLAIDVLPFGAGPDWNRLGAAQETVLVDAAASFDGCTNFPFPKGIKAGVMVSLHATKSLPAGEGGVFFSNDQAWVEDFRRWANFGMWGSRVSQVPGTNGKMSEVTAAVGLASLDNWKSDRQRWVELGEESFRISTELDVLPHGDTTRELATPYWNIRLKDETTRQGLEWFLREKGIETRCWWGDGCHTMPAYKDVAHDALPQTALHAQTVLGLPCHFGVTPHDFDRIRSTIGRYLDGHPA